MTHMMKWFVAFAILSIPVGASLFAQMPPSQMKNAPPSGPQDMERMMAEVKTSKTDSSNFEKRANFARGWIMLLVTGGKTDDVQKIAPPGTIPRIRETVASSPERAYRELDQLFRELERLGMPRQPASSPPAGSRFPPAGPSVGTPLVAPGVTSQEITVINPSSNARLWAKVYRPDRPGEFAKYPAVLYIPGALGFGSNPIVGQAAMTIAADGFVVAVFDPDGRGKSGGKEDWNGLIQQDGLRSLTKSVAGMKFVEKNNIGIVSLSYGVALAAGVMGRYPADPVVKYLIDVEGPSDRFSITLNDSHVALSAFDNHGTAETKWWKDREPVRRISRMNAMYLRIQNERDHTQPENNHAIELVNAATNLKYGGQGISPWTRVNGPENAANKVYSRNNLPTWLPGKGMPAPAVILHYIREMSEKTKEGQS